MQKLGRRIEPDSSSFFITALAYMEEFDELIIELADPAQKKLMVSNYYGGADQCFSVLSAS